MTILRKSSDYRKREGSALFLVLALVIVFSSVGLGLLSLARHDAVETARLLDRKRALWMAESGLNYMRALLYQQQNYTLLENLNLVSDDNDTPVFSRDIDGIGSFDVIVRPLTGGIGVAYQMESVGFSPSGESSASVWTIVRPQTLSKYAYGSGDERKYKYTTGDKITGPFHTNGKLYIKYFPKFYGQVSSSWDTLFYNVRPYRGGANSTYVDPTVFTQGLYLGAEEMDFKYDFIDDLQGIAKMHDGSYEVVVDDERYFLRKIGDSQWTTNGFDTINSLAASDNVLYFTGDVSVRGKVGGALAIASEGTINITGDLTYSSAPFGADYETWVANGTYPDRSERLGLYARGRVDVNISDDPATPDVDERNRDVNIHAAIYITEPQGIASEDGTNAGFGTPYWDVQIGEPTINLFGSLVQYIRGKVGATDGSGYLKNYHHDPRFLYINPPAAKYGKPDISGWSYKLW